MLELVEQTNTETNGIGEVELRVLQVEIPTELHRAIRIYAAHNGITIRKFVELAVRVALTQEGIA